MRILVVLFCLGGLAFFLMMAGFGVPWRTGEQSKASTLPARTAVVRARLEKNSADRPGLEQTTLAVVPDTATLLQQIQNGLSSGNPGDQAAVFTNQYLALIRSDPWAAAIFAESTEAGSLHSELMRILAVNWAELNLSDAEKWVSQIADSNERDTMLSCVCFKVAETDPSRAIKTLEQQGLNNDRREVMLGNLAQQWAQQDLPRAVSWANTYPPGKNRDNLFAQIAYAEAQTSPTKAAQRVVDQISPGSIQQAAAMSVLQQWATQDMAGAMAWAEEFPTGELYDRAIIELADMAAPPAPCEPLKLQQSP